MPRATAAAAAAAAAALGTPRIEATRLIPSTARLGPALLIPILLLLLLLRLLLLALLVVGGASSGRTPTPTPQQAPLENSCTADLTRQAGAAQPTPYTAPS
jgi:hypothetical protein